jgi:hypothetical protein
METKGARISTIHLHETTTSTPEQYLAGLTDFGLGRSNAFSNSADEYLKVHDRGPSQADVTEGSGGIWERLHYDWSDPDHVVLTTTDSNTWGGASGHTYTLETPARWFDRHRRSASSAKGRTSRDGCSGRARDHRHGGFEKAFENSVRAIEARDGGARPARSS